MKITMQESICITDFRLTWPKSEFCRAVGVGMWLYSAVLDIGLPAGLEVVQTNACGTLNTRNFISRGLKSIV